MKNLIIGAEKPDYAKMPDKWSYCELKDYFDGMAGIPFRSSDIADVLMLFDIEAMFGGITKEEILDLMFNT